MGRQGGWVGWWCGRRDQWTSGSGWVQPPVGGYGGSKGRPRPGALSEAAAPYIAPWHAEGGQGGATRGGGQPKGQVGPRGHPCMPQPRGHYHGGHAAWQRAHSSSQATVESRQGRGGHARHDVSAVSGVCALTLREAPHALVLAVCGLPEHCIVRGYVPRPAQPAIRSVLGCAQEVHLQLTIASGLSVRDCGDERGGEGEEDEAPGRLGEGIVSDPVVRRRLAGPRFRCGYFDPSSAAKCAKQRPK